MKIELLKDNPDTNILHDLWRQSFNIRRLHVREIPLEELLERFPGYRHADLVRNINDNQLRIIFRNSLYMNILI